LHDNAQHEAHDIALLRNENHSSYLVSTLFGT
jgi:hypothetical protein